MRDTTPTLLRVPEGGAARLFHAPAVAVLAEGGGPVALVLYVLADALACKRRLGGGAA